MRHQVEIDRLRQELAERDAEIERLKDKQAHWNLIPNAQLTKERDEAREAARHLWKEWVLDREGKLPHYDAEEDLERYPWLEEDESGRET